MTHKFLELEAAFFLLVIEIRQCNSFGINKQKWGIISCTRAEK